ncbi:hypothetical protein NLM33_33165 [Bradyrhizobium sp. CCGUVB1N3]|uniref:hypothetical protein n=1 Tax=Bradyrhizobium sp. CCGUVB1N3 TaxID=2949629 RepID=UPI0020B231B0|nr:hypothetical protein [Bradyrhizobium sp. CCGUVB1N3]MCP3475175.1 hypothetical protein [Bradyrhizobium sp. CCGUVB1N3]
MEASPRTPDYVTKLKVVSILARLAIDWVRLIHAGYRRNNHSPAAMTTDHLVAFSIAANDPQGEGKRLNVSQIAKELAIDRRVARDTLDYLVKAEIVDAVDGSIPLYGLIVKEGRVDWDRLADMVEKAADDIRAVRRKH